MGKTKKKKNRIIRRLIFIFCVFICIFSVISLVYKNFEKNLTDSEIQMYIDCADEVSENKVQINWKYVAAIDTIVNKNYSKHDEDKIKSIASMFIEQDEKSKEYNLKSLDYVLGILGTDDKKIKKVHTYLDDIKYEGLKSSRLRDDSKYMQFIKSIEKGAIENYNDYKILPSITIAQAILESSWGKSELSVDGNNLFGIKADSSWSGEVINMNTTENYDTKINSSFRKYKTKEESIKDHGKFIYENKRYRENGVFESNCYRYQAKALENSGYSTKTNEAGEKIYADLLIDIIQTYNLQLIDSYVQEQK